MLLETIESEGLAHLSYLIGDESAGVCAVVDPRRDVGIYLDLARQHQCRITHILETHIHADFVSGSLELAEQVKAPVFVGAAAGYGFDHQPLKDGDSIELGSIRLETIHTPGHTPEHVCYLVSGGKGSQEPWGLFTGDTLFAGEVGRPDLIGGGTEQDLARRLHDSLHNRLLCLGDQIEIYPAHGEGSPCGGNIGDRKTSTLGYERLNSPHLQIPDVDAFAEKLLGSLPEPPAYYPRMKKVNARGPELIGCLEAIPSLDPAGFCRAMEREGAVILDSREIEAFGGAHVEGALNIPLRLEFPIWCGWMLKPDQTLLLAAQRQEDIDPIQRHLLRIGLDRIAGFLRNGMRGWIEAGLPFRDLPQMSVHCLHDRLKSSEKLQLLDVRRPDEWKKGRIPTARHIFAPHLPRHLQELDPEAPTAVYCGSGYRASIAASLLMRNGFRDVANVPGSMKAWKAAGFETAPPGQEADDEKQAAATSSQPSKERQA